MWKISERDVERMVLVVRAMGTERVLAADEQSAKNRTARQVARDQGIDSWRVSVVRLKEGW